MRYLGVDPGGRRIGLAIGDDETGAVSPLRVVAVTGVAASARAIVGCVATYDAETVVIGVPTRADGTSGSAARRSELLAEAVRELGVETVLQAEFLSTDEARRRARDIGRSPRQPIDDLAAQVILEEYLESKPGRASHGGG